MHMAHHWNPAHFGIRTKKHKLIFYYGLPITGSENATLPAWELYDMEKDPHEMNNVYSDPAYAGAREKLKDELKRVRRELKEEDSSPAINAVLEKHWES
jgi:arylsulfatase A-like enzyme